MAASTHARGRATTSFQPVGTTTGGNVISVTAQYSVTSALSANDVIQMIKVPNQARIQKVIFRGQPVTAGNAWTYTVGDGGSTARFIGSKSISSTLTNAESVLLAVGGYKYSFTPAATQWDTIDVKFTAVTATVALKFSLTVWYTVDGLALNGTP